MCATHHCAVCYEPNLQTCCPFLQLDDKIMARTQRLHELGSQLIEDTLMGDSSSGKVGSKHQQDAVKGRQKSLGRGRLATQLAADGGRSLSSGSSNGSGSDNERLLPRLRRGKLSQQRQRVGRGRGALGASDSELDDDGAQSMSGSAASRDGSASSASASESENQSGAQSEMSKLTSESDSEDSAVVAAAEVPVPSGRGRGRGGGGGRGRGRGAGVDRADAEVVGKRMSRGRNASKPVFTMLEVPSREQVVSAALLSSRWG
jgi:hypothetical protein